MVNEVRGEEKKAGSKTACVSQNLSPGQIGEQGPHCSPAARAALWANNSNQICVIGLRKSCKGIRGSFHPGNGHKEAYKNLLSLC